MPCSRTKCSDPNEAQVKHSTTELLQDSVCECVCVGGGGGGHVYVCAGRDCTDTLCSLPWLPNLIN